MSAPKRQHDGTAAPARPALSVVTTNPVDVLLSRLERVRTSGRGWTAKCPGHEDRTASLSITAGDDGRVLLHCFAGCSASDVVAAAGLTIADLFVKRPTADMTFAERATLKEYGRQAQWRAALNVVGLEVTIVAIAAHDLIHKKPLSADDVKRLNEAVQRINEAKGVLCVQSS